MKPYAQEPGDLSGVLETNAVFKFVDDSHLISLRSEIAVLNEESLRSVLHRRFNTSRQDAAPDERLRISRGLT